MSDMTLAMLLTLRDLASGPLGKVQGRLQSFAMEVRAIGATAKQMGSQMLDAMRTPITAFMDAEDAALRLKVATMGAGGVVSKDFAAMEKQAIALGNKLPGTAAEMQNMFAVLAKAGVSTKDILGGTGEAAGNLAVLLKMDFAEAASFAAKTSQSMGIAAKDMNGWMDTIQRVAHLNVGVTDMGYAFAKTGATLKSMGVSGKTAADNFVPIIAHLIKAGNSGETVGTNLTAMLTNLKQIEMNPDKQFAKVRSSLKSMGVELDVFDKMGKLKGPRELVSELGKLKNLAPEKQLKAIRDVFGSGADSQFALDLINSGAKGYDTLLADMKKQADLNERIKVVLTSLTNIWESAMGAFQTMLAGLGKAIAPELKAAADWFGRMSDKVGTLIENNPGIAKFVGLTALIGGGTLIAGGTALMGVAAAASGVSSAGNLMAKVKLADRIADIGTSAKNTVGAVKTWNTSTGNMLKSSFLTADLGQGFKNLAGTAGNSMRQVGASIKAIPTNAGNSFHQIRAGLNGIRTNAATSLRNVGAAIKALPDNIGPAIKGLPAQLRAMRTAASAQLVAGLKGIALGIRAMGLAALGNPLLWVAIAIAGAAILIFKYWKPITAFFKGVWAGIKEGLAPLRPVFASTFATLAPILKPIMGALKSLWGWIKNLLKPVDDVGGKSQNMGKQFGLAIAGMISKGVELLTWFSGLVGKFTSIGKDIVNGLKAGFVSAWEGLKSTVSGLANMLPSFVRGPLKTQSPSRVFMAIGDDLGTGLSLGMLATTSRLADSANKMALATIPKTKQLSAPALVGSRPGSGAIGSSGGSNITFAPVLQITAAPGSNIGSQVQQAITDSYPQFVALMRRYEHDQRRGNPA